MANNPQAVLLARRRERLPDIWDDLQGNCEAVARQLSVELAVEVKPGVIYRDRDALGLPRVLQGRRLTRAALEQQKAAAVERYAAGETGAEIGADFGVSAVQVLRWIPVEMRRPGGPRRKHPVPELRKCANAGDPECPTRDGLFQPAPEPVAKGQGNYCCNACYWKSESLADTTRARVTERHRLADAAFEALKATADLLDTADLAARWLTSHQNISDYYVALGLESRRYNLHGAVRILYPRTAVEQFEKDWLRTTDSRQLNCRLTYLEPEKYVHYLRKSGKLERIAQRMGLSVDDTATLMEKQARRRQKHFKRFLKGPRGPNLRTLRRAQWFEETRVELEKAAERARCAGFEDGTASATDWQISLAVAEKEAALDPERWRPYINQRTSAIGPEFAESAATLIWNSVKSLQISLRKKRAA